MSESASEKSALSPPGSEAPGRFRRYRWRIVLAAVVGLAALKAADVVVGVAANSRERHLLRLVPESSLRHKSNEFDYVFRVNRLGLRGPDIPFSKPPGTFRIVVLGDSFVAGYGVAEEHLLTGYLQEELAGRTRERPAAGEAAPRAIEVVNVGRVGTSTIRELDLYEKLGRRFAPDLVVLAYYLGNDRAEIMQEQTHAELAAWHPDGRVRRLAFAVFPNLYLELAMIRQFSRQRRTFSPHEASEIADDLRNEARARGGDPEAAVARFEALPLKIREDAAAGMLSEQRIIDSCIEPDRLERSLDSDAPCAAEAWARTAEHLDLLQQSVRRDRARLVLVAIPAPVQVDRRSLDFHRALGYNVHESWLEGLADTSLMLAEWAGQRDVPLLDLTTRFRDAEEPLYFIEDVHFTPAGNAAAARAIADFLLNRGLCP